MSSYVPKIVHTVEFEGDTVVFEMNPLEKGHMMRISEMTRDSSYSIACEVLDRHIQDMRGLKDNDGVAVTKEVFLDKVYFKNLVVEVFAELLARAGLGKVLRSNSEEKSQES